MAREGSTPSSSGRPARSLLVWRADDGSGDTPDDILGRVIDRLRRENAIDGAREISLAITHCQEARHWLRDLAERRGQHDHSNGNEAAHAG